MMVAFVGRSGGDAPGIASIAMPNHYQVLVVGANGQDLRQVTTGPVWHSLLLWMPGRPAVADIAFTGRSQRAWIESQRTSASRHRKLSATVSTVWPDNLSFSPASRLTAVESCCENGTGALEIVGKPGSRPTTLDSWPNIYAIGSQVAGWSPNGRSIAAYLPQSQSSDPRTAGLYDEDGWPITVIAPDGQKRRVLTPDLADNNVTPVFSPNGRSILFCSQASATGLYTVPTAGGAVHRMPLGAPCPDVMAWSPNGRQIAYIRQAFGSTHAYLFVVNVRTGRVKRLAGPVQDNGALAWSLNGKKIAFAGPTAPTGSTAVETINSGGTGIRALVHMRGYSATFALAWSPNSRQIAFTGGPAPVGY